VDSITRSEGASKLAIGLGFPDQALMRLRWAAAVGWTMVIMLLCWLPRGVVREAARVRWIGIPHIDKVVHVGIFIVFAILWLRARAVRGRHRYAWVVLGGFVLAIVTELGQLVEWVGRDASIEDALTDAAGLVVGLMLAPFLEPLLRLAESKLLGATAAPASPASVTPASVTSE
jgi:hypothetical protein